jgi:hypothetical protein
VWLEAFGTHHPTDAACTISEYRLVVRR